MIVPFCDANVIKRRDSNEKWGIAMDVSTNAFGVLSAGVTFLSLFIFIGYLVVSAFGCAYLAATKNRGVIGFFFLGLFLNVLGLLIAVGVPERRTNQNQAAITDNQGGVAPSSESWRGGPSVVQIVPAILVVAAIIWIIVITLGEAS